VPPPADPSDQPSAARRREIPAAPPQATPTLAELGEDRVLSAIFPLLPAAASALVGPGDDAAVLRAPDGRTVATTDVLVQGRDFRLDWSTAQDVGWKAAAQNLADVAAMGATPSALLVALVAPPGTPVAWATGLAQGLAEACVGTGAGVVGGDLSSGDQLVVCVTALGDLGGRAPVLRSGAGAGDVVAVAGGLGRSAAGLELLWRGRAELAPELVAAHRRPRPPYDAGPLAADAGATAMLDVSDGLVRDLGRLARASGVSVDLAAAALGEAFGGALVDAAQALGDGDPLDWVLSGGEDHALVATFPAGARLPAGFVAVGEVRAAGGGGPQVLVDGHPSSAGSWDHFRPG
jgi:thiamine-monophosphate kinase